jgi:hypothetical protein
MITYNSLIGDRDFSETLIWERWKSLGVQLARYLPVGCLLCGTDHRFILWSIFALCTLPAFELILTESRPVRYSIQSSTFPASSCPVHHIHPSRRPMYKLGICRRQKAVIQITPSRPGIVLQAHLPWIEAMGARASEGVARHRFWGAQLWEDLASACSRRADRKCATRTLH